MTTEAIQTIIDVRTLVPRDCHDIISRVFSSFRKLAAGETFELVNDHDPRPLFFRLDAEHPGGVTWSYVEQGPQTWRVRIGKAAGGCGGTGRCTCN